MALIDIIDELIQKIEGKALDGVNTPETASDEDLELDTKKTIGIAEYK